MKKENRISLVTLLIGFLIFFDFKPYSKSNCKSCFIIDWNFCYCRKHSIREKAKNPKNFGILQAIRSIIPKTKNTRQKK